MQKIITSLWFDNNAEEAAKFYVSIFKNSKIGEVTRYGEAGMGSTGNVMSVTFQLEGQEFFAINGGPTIQFTEAISLFVNCESQQEVDALWAKLLAGGGKESHCGWLKDKYGLSWQIIPNALMRMMRDKDAQKAARVTAAMLQMVKIDLAGLQKAYDGNSGVLATISVDHDGKSRVFAPGRRRSKYRDQNSPLSGWDAGR